MSVQKEIEDIKKKQDDLEEFKGKHEERSKALLAMLKEVKTLFSETIQQWSSSFSLCVKENICDIKEKRFDELMEQNKIDRNEQDTKIEKIDGKYDKHIEQHNSINRKMNFTLLGVLISLILFIFNLLSNGKTP